VEEIPGGGIGVSRSPTGGVFRLDARSAKGLSSSMKGEPLKGEVFPNPPEPEPKSPRGGDAMLYN